MKVIAPYKIMVVRTYILKFLAHWPPRVQMIIQQCHIGMFFLMLEYNVILPLFSEWAVLPLRIFFILIKYFNSAVIFPWKFWLLRHLQPSDLPLAPCVPYHHYNKMIWKIVYNNCRRTFISPTCLHLQIVSKLVLSSMNTTNLHIPIFLVCNTLAYRP